ncbi:hypothetical protein XENE109146_18485 [Xenorhabdus nematophila]
MWDVCQVIGGEELRAGIAACTLPAQLPHQSMFLTQNKAFVRLAVAFVSVFVPFKREPVPAMDVEQTQFACFVCLRGGGPLAAIRHEQGARYLRIVRVIAGDIAVCLGFADKAVFIIVFKGQRFSLRRGHFK